MKRSFLFLPVVFVLLALGACESTAIPRSSSHGSVPHAPIRDRPTSSPVASRTSRQTAPPDAQLIYQNGTSSGTHRTTSSGVYRQHGAVTEEIHIGNQPVYPGYSPGPTNLHRGSLQPGYVPPGTTGIYDPATGRTIPVRR